MVILCCTAYCVNHNAIIEIVQGSKFFTFSRFTIQVQSVLLFNGYSTLIGKYHRFHKQTILMIKGLPQPFTIFTNIKNILLMIFFLAMFLVKHHFLME